MNQPVNDLVSDIENLIGTLAPDGGASHRRFLNHVQHFPDTELRRQFDKSIARRDFRAAGSTLRRMMKRSPTPACGS
ncbi:MAG: hypothetical protein HUJ31_16325 [Pseudomonadales bacterium]|nr:hypothetical protein [Pseudomonadales bacterium]